MTLCHPKKKNGAEGKPQWDSLAHFQMSPRASRTPSEESLVHWNCFILWTLNFLIFPTSSTCTLCPVALNPVPALLSQRIHLWNVHLEYPVWLQPPILILFYSFILTDAALGPKQNTEALDVSLLPGFTSLPAFLGWSPQCNSPPFLSSLPTLLFCNLPPTPQPVLKIEELGLVALMRIRKLEKAVHLRGHLNLTERKYKVILEVTFS